jgi:DeoR/GlpR family transcriptional regulator of sugar metabolism
MTMNDRQVVFLFSGTTPLLLRHVLCTEEKIVRVITTQPVIIVGSPASKF